MNKTITYQNIFECQVRSVDEFGRSSSLWVPVHKSLDLEEAKASALEELEKQKEEKNKLEFQVVNGRGDTLCTLKAPYNQWILHYTPEEIKKESFVTKEEFRSLKRELFLTRAFSAMTFAGLLVLYMITLIAI